jgi:flagellar hook protein FlgE
MTSGNPLDVYIQGAGWLRVGLGDGRTVPTDFQYTRAGNLTINASGNLTTQDGHYLVGLDATATASGTGFTYAPGTRDSYITIPPGSTDTTIGQDGGVSYIDQDARSRTFGQRVTAGYLALAKFSNEGGLQRTGGSLWLQSASTGAPTIGTPNTSGFGQTNAGMLEMSNVDLATQFTTMITAQRGFQANSRVISTADEMLQDLVNLKR